MKKRNSLIRKILYACLLSIGFFSCTKKDVVITPGEKGKISVNFDQMVNEDPFILDSLIYSTSSGNQYMVNDLQYFISRFKIHAAGGKWITISSDSGIHYTDVRTESSRMWSITDNLPYGNYDSVSFVFGLDNDDNRSYRFANPPESNMFWPEVLGGGYHYMKMNLKWKNNAMAEQMPFMFHLGIGQMYSGVTADPDSIIGFIQNWFPVSAPVAFTCNRDETVTIRILMHVEKWFDAVAPFNFADYPMGIMQDQQGMYTACRNGRKVFEIVIPGFPDL
jgi:hypothetical protein